jgi:hypothetical protein
MVVSPSSHAWFRLECRPACPSAQRTDSFTRHAETSHFESPEVHPVGSRECRSCAARHGRDHAVSQGAATSTGQVIVLVGTGIGVVGTAGMQGVYGLALH